VLDGRALGGLAPGAKLALQLHLTILDVFDLLLGALVVLEPLQGRVVLPRVHAIDRRSFDLLVWTFFGTILVQEIVFLFV